MGFISLVSDSSAGMSLAFAERHRVPIVPLYIHMQGSTYRDLYDLEPDTFYTQLPQCDPLPTTSQPSAGDFVKVYEDLIAQGAEGIISVHLSSGISGTVNSAQLAAQRFEGVPIEIVDTQTACAAHLLAVEAGLHALKAGKGFAEVVGAVRQAIAAQRELFVVDTLEYLYKGGRIGGAAALLGSLLQFKPILCFNQGRIDALERVRTSSKAVARMVELMREWLGDAPVQAVVMHAAAEERARALAAALPATLNIAAVRIWPVPPVLGAHTGPGVVAVACCPISACGLPFEGGQTFA